MSCDFKTTIGGKSIIAGEHAVIRNHPAILYPVSCVNLTFNFSEDTSFESRLPDIVWNVITKAFETLAKPLPYSIDNFSIDSTIRSGAGLGASAALCVAVSQWLTSLKLLSFEQQFDFSKQLENLFHGESSGADIAVALKQTPLIYQRNVPLTELIPAWKPNWYLSFTGQTSSTQQCINTAKKLWEDNAAKAQQVDQQMLDGVHRILKALTTHTSSSLTDLADALNQTQDCFRQWQLSPDFVEQHMTQLKQRGAMAVKLTGSGGGGHVLSLWKDTPPSDINLTPIG